MRMRLVAADEVPPECGVQMRGLGNELNRVTAMHLRHLFLALLPESVDDV
jgi:hypothetical protein